VSAIEIEERARKTARTYIWSTESLELGLFDECTRLVTVSDYEEDQQTCDDSSHSDSFRRSSTSLNFEVVSGCVCESLELFDTINGALPSQIGSS